MKTISRLWALLILLLGVCQWQAGPVDAQAPPVATRPAAVTDSAIARGKEVFRGPANCVACHGENGQGTELGPNLTDAKWIHGSGLYGEILERVLHGQTRRASSINRPMPMRGWSPGSDADVRTVAAYVWWLGHTPKTAK